MELLLAKAISITSQAFENVVDKGGHPYILHCLRVMDGVKNEDTITKICAVMHDLVEDNHKTKYSWDFPDLLREGFPQEVITILELLTHRKGTDYMDYIRAISVHPKATKIKLADIDDNMDVKRLKGLEKKDFNRIHKYAVAYTYLKG